MSTEHFVNRVNQGPFFDQLKPVEESEPIAEPTLSKVGPAPVFETGAPAQADWVEKWQKTVPSEAPPVDVAAEEPNGNLATVHDPVAEGLPVPEVDVIKTLIDIATRVQQDYAAFQKFKTQTIMALKHQGVDVRKYFPENSNG